MWSRDHACLAGTHSQTRRCFRIIWCVQGSQVLSVSHSIQLLDLFFLMEGVTELPIRQIHWAELPIPLFKRFSPRHTSTLFNCARRQYSVIARDSCFVISLDKVGSVDQIVGIYCSTCIFCVCLFVCLFEHSTRTLSTDYNNTDTEGKLLLLDLVVWMQALLFTTFLV